MNIEITFLPDGKEDESPESTKEVVDFNKTTKMKDSLLCSLVFLAEKVDNRENNEKLKEKKILIKFSISYL